MPLILGSQSATAAAYSIGNSCKFNGSDTYLSRTSSAAAPTNAYKATLSFWVKDLDGKNPSSQRYLVYTNGGSSPYFQVQLTDSSGKLTVQDFISGGSTTEFVTTRVLHDCSSWMHIVYSYDSTPATPSSSSIKLFINGVQQTAFTTETYPSQNTATKLTTASVDYPIGVHPNTTAQFLNSYLAEYMVVDGQSLEATDFGEFNEDSPTIWQPKDISGISVGAQGFYLKFSNSADLGEDSGGNDFDFTSNNIDATNSATDSPTNNFCTMTPLTGSAVTYTEGNCVTDFAGLANWNNGALSTMGVNAGKWYWEIKIITGSTTNGTGVIRDTDLAYASNSSGIYIQNVNCMQADRYIYKQDDADDNSTFTAWADGEFVSIALDMTAGKMWFAKDGDWQADSATGDPAAGSGEQIDSSNFTAGAFYIPFNFGNDSGANPVLAMSFGGCPGFTVASSNTDENGYGSFEYAPPSGFLALCSKNLGSDGG